MRSGSILFTAFLAGASIIAAGPSLVQAQQAAVAKPVTGSTGRPSSIAIRQNILAQKSAVLQGQLREASRCLYTAQLPQVRRDFQGNINRVPETDIINCGRKLRELERQIKSLAREAEQLSQDARIQQFSVVRRLEELKRRARLIGISAQ